MIVSTAAGRRARAGPPQHTARGCADPQAVLDRMPVGHGDFRRMLDMLLKTHNHAHATKHKGVSLKTMHEREKFLFAFFAELRTHTPYRQTDPRQLATRHIEAMIERWLQRDLAAGTIHNYLSILRVFSGWIGKPGLVRKPAYYLGTASPKAHRTQVATFDHSWSAQGIDVAQVIAQAREIDPFVALRLELCHQFGLRVKESGHLRPHESIVDRSQVPAADAACWPEAEQFLLVSRGTKGGRPRVVPILTQAQRELLSRVLALIAPGHFVGDPARSAKQNGRRIYYVFELIGVTRKRLGVVAHGLRHERANDELERATGQASPVRGGGALANPTAFRDARRQVSRLLGHGRARVLSYYVGSLRRPRPDP